MSEFRDGDYVLVSTERGGDSGPVFLLLHGIGMGRCYFEDLSEALATAGSVIALDLPGFNDSPEPDRPLSFPEQADLVAKFLRERVGRPVVAVGHSMGTQVVAELAVRHPQLVEHVVLIAPTVNAKERSAAKQVWRMLQDLAGEHPKVFVTGLRLYAKSGPRWFLIKFREMLGHHIEDVAPKIAAPTLVMRGERDKVCPRDWVESVARQIPNSTMQEVPGRSHEAMITSAEPVAQMILDFARA